jgi:hypothetical protein
MASRDLFWRILQALATTAAGLKLEGIEDHVYVQVVPDETVGYSVGRKQVVDVLFPAVLFSLDTEAERRGLEDTGSKGWIFPARCWVADKNDLHRHGKLPVYLGARKALFDAFDEQPLAGVAEAVNMLVIPAALFDPRLPNYQHIVSGFVVEVETEEER